MIPHLRNRFNRNFSEGSYQKLLTLLEAQSGTKIHFRVAETPVFLSGGLLNEISLAGERLTRRLLSDPQYLAAANQAIPKGWRAAGKSAHPNFLTADFALVRDTNGELSPRLVEIQAFPSLYGFQMTLARCYGEAYGVASELGVTLGGLSSGDYWSLLKATVLGSHEPEQVVLMEVDPEHQKTLPDFKVTQSMLGVPIVDVRTIESEGAKVFYRDRAGKRIEIRRIFNRAIADELIVRKIQLPFDWKAEWDVEWAGHPNWYSLISKFSLPWLDGDPVVPPCVFLNEFLEGSGRARLEAGWCRAAQNVFRCGLWRAFALVTLLLCGQGEDTSAPHRLNLREFQLNVGAIICSSSE